MKSLNKDIYDPQFVKGMFDRMSKTYGVANYVSSFGFTARWRRQCVNDLPEIDQASVGYDLMSGMGEAWGDIQRKVLSEGKIIAVDISDDMNKKAAEHTKRLKVKNVELLKMNVLNDEIPSDSADFIISTFGIKTFSLEQQEQLAKTISRVLKPRGAFSLAEVSEPNGWFLKFFYMLYLKRIIPFIGKYFLGNAEDYRMLGVYCEEFKDSRSMLEFLRREGLEVSFRSYFFGCATGVVGRKGQLGFKKNVPIILNDQDADSSLS
ncbi:class I SAM-dependent methyltransferase [Flammeovirgaceae bacterium SG7u.111]|nr:class I SAM-dependent methyltransferase [Flammeovirgaceae bacterium SG7u.132]WPO33480.1 class I SAM-dependent methyltransferase [Flammeovirgaceae bacterium SG7u.111]